MKVLASTPAGAPASTSALPRPIPVESSRPPAPAAGTRSALAEEPFKRVTRLAALALGTPLASVTFTDERPAAGKTPLAPPETGGEWSTVEGALCEYVIESGVRLVCDATLLDLRAAGGGCPLAPDGAAGWAGFPVRGPDGRVAGALCVADRGPRHWSARDVEVLEILADVAAGEVALAVALRHGAERAAMARTLQESLLPPRLPEIPGLQIAARYRAGGRGAEVLGDFYDVFPSVRGSWGMVVGDVCGKGAPAAKSTALARYTLRAEAHRQTRPSYILAALNQALLDWLTDDPRFLTAIYATIRPTATGASVRISSAGHPLALVRRSDGRVQPAGQPGTLLGLLPDPELHDRHVLLRAGDSLIMFTDGITEARHHASRALYGDNRLRDLIAGLHGMPAAEITVAIQQAALEFGGGQASDDTVTLVLTVPPVRKEQPARAQRAPGLQRGHRAGLLARRPAAR